MTAFKGKVGYVLSRGVASNNSARRILYFLSSDNEIKQLEFRSLKSKSFVIF
jgi:hypothetical protein